MLLYAMGGVKAPKSMSLRIPKEGGGACWTRHKALCCTHDEGGSQIGRCKWEGGAPFWAGEGFKYTCEETFRSPLTYGSVGAGGGKPCVSGTKSMCCTQPSPYQ